MTDCPSIDAARLWGTLMALAEIGATPVGGVRRLALDDADRRARDRLVAWCSDAGCTIRVDAVGNVFARRRGRDDARAVVMAGSHLDTQPNGGRFDGAYGVVAALEVLRTLNDAGIETNAPVELVAWSNEEGTRFAPSMMGSMAHAGLLERRQVLDSTDVAGLRYGDELARIGYAGDGLGDVAIAAYFEAHIEQGPVLEARGATIGVVTGGQGQRWYDLRLTGQAAHAGSTPMPGRRDALVGAARVVEATRRIGAGRPDGRATVGRLEVVPNSRNVVPGEVRLTIEIRHPDDIERHAMDAELHAAVHEATATEGLGFRMDEVLEQPATPFDARCVAAVRDAARIEGLCHLDIVSGAAHDAVAIARIAPAAMVFVPCAGGISHDESESATPADLAAGTQVLLRAMLAACGHPAAHAPRRTGEATRMRPARAPEVLP
ncbi:MAG: Zn-dependent hydrolase [Betaproteobacteria bacterium]